MESYPLKEKILVFSPTCPACDLIKEALHKKGVLQNYRMVDVSTVEGKNFAKRLGITYVPDCAIIVEDKDGVKARRCTESELSEILG